MAKETIVHGYRVITNENLTPEQVEHNKAWIEELRSGKYSQVTGTLHNDQGY